MSEQLTLGGGVQSFDELIEDPTKKQLRSILSYGGGVQTFAMLIMIERGEIPPPDCLIFADTGCEWPHTYEHIENVAKPICERLNIPFYTVQYGEGLIEGYKSRGAIPMAGFRSCTSNYKVLPIHQFIKKMWPEEKKNGKASFISLIGISTDEVRRVVSRKDQAPKWMLLKYPLIERDISRSQCLEIIESSPYEMAQKSGCYICPYAGLQEWAVLKKQHPSLLAAAVEFEEVYRATYPNRRIGLLGNDRQMWLKDFASLSSLFDFTDYEEPITMCDSTENGGCFL